MSSLEIIEVTRDLTIRGPEPDDSGVVEGQNRRRVIEVCRYNIARTMRLYAASLVGDTAPRQVHPSQPSHQG